MLLLVEVVQLDDVLVIDLFEQKSEQKREHRCSFGYFYLVVAFRSVLENIRAVHRRGAREGESGKRRESQPRKYYGNST